MADMNNLSMTNTPDYAEMFQADYDKWVTDMEAEKKQNTTPPQPTPVEQPKEGNDWKTNFDQKAMAVDPGHYEETKDPEGLMKQVMNAPGAFYNEGIEQVTGYISARAAIAMNESATPEQIEQEYAKYRNAIPGTEIYELKQRARQYQDKVEAEGWPMSYQDAELREVMRWYAENGGEKRALKWLEASSKVRSLKADVDPEAEGLIIDVAKGAASLVASVTEGAAAAVTGPGAPVTAFALTSTRIFGRKYEAIYNELKRKFPKMPTSKLADRAFQAALIGAGAEGALERIGVAGALFKKAGVKGVQQIFKHYFTKGVASEGLTELLQEYPDQIVFLWATNPELDAEQLYALVQQKLPEMTKDAMYSGLIGGILGGGTSVAAGTFKSAVEKYQQKPTQEQNNQKIIDAMPDDIFENTSERASRPVDVDLTTPEGRQAAIKSVRSDYEMEVAKYTKAQAEAKKATERAKSSPIKEDLSSKEKQSQARTNFVQQLVRLDNIDKEQLRYAHEVIDRIGATAVRRGYVKDIDEFYNFWFSKLQSGQDPAIVKSEITMTEQANAQSDRRIQELKDEIEKTEDTKEKTKLTKRLKTLENNKEKLQPLLKEWDKVWAEGGNVNPIADKINKLRGGLFQEPIRIHETIPEGETRRFGYWIKRLTEANRGKLPQEMIDDFREFTGKQEGKKGEQRKTEAEVTEWVDKWLEGRPGNVEMRGRLFNTSYGIGYASKYSEERLRQDSRGQVQNLFTDLPKVITIFEKGDVSSIIHETGHILLDMMETYGDEGFIAASEFVGADPNTLARDWTRDQHETFAKAFEKYLMDGVAPSSKLKTLFENMKTWLTSIYSTLADNYFRDASGKKIEINPEVKQVFDRWLTQDMVKTRRQEFIKKQDSQEEGFKVSKDQLNWALNVAGAEGARVHAEIIEKEKNIDNLIITGKEEITFVPENFIEEGNPSDFYQAMPGNEMDGTNKDIKSILDEAGLPYVADVNINKIGTFKQLKEIESDLENFYKGRLDEQTRGKHSLALTRTLAERLIGDGVLDEQQLQELLPGTAFNAEKVAASLILLGQAKKYKDNAAKIVVDNAKRGIVNTEHRAEYVKATTQYIGIYKSIRGIAAEAGRALSAFRTSIGSQEMMRAEMADKMEATNLSGDVDKMAKEYLDMLDKTQDKDQMREALMASEAEAKSGFVWNLVHTYYVANLLWSPMTWMRNIIGNMAGTAMSLTDVTTGALVGELMKLKDGKKSKANQYITFREAAAAWQGMFEGTKEAWGMLKDVVPMMLRGEELPPEMKISGGQLRYHTDFGPNTKVSNKKMINLLWRALTFNLNILEAGDIAFVKGVNTSLHKRRIAYREALKHSQQNDFTDEQFAKLYKDMMSNPAKHNLDKEIKEEAEKTAYRNKLGEFGSKLSSTLNTSLGPKGLKPLKIITPFMKTPINLYKTAFRYSPFFQQMSKEWWTNATGKNGKNKQQEAMAQMTVAYSASGVLMMAAAEGLITGAGPADDEQRKLLRSTGWQPFSVKLGDKYYSYNNIEPLAFPVALAATTYEIVSQQWETDEDEDSVLGTLTFTMLHYITDKSMMRGISEFISALNDKDGYQRDTFLHNIATNVAIPYKSAMGYFESIFDPEYRNPSTANEWRGEDVSMFVKEATKLTRDAASRLPYFSKNLPPFLNYWGEPMSASDSMAERVFLPVRATKSKPDKLTEELMRLDAPLSMPPRYATINTVKVPLKPTEYNAYIKLTNSMGTDDPMALRKELRKLTEDRLYKDLPDEEKIKMIREMVNYSREIARTILPVEFPEIGAYTEEELRKKYNQ